MQFMTMVTEINMEDGAVRSVTTDKGETWYADEVVAAVGREGADWFSHICSGHSIETQVGTVDIGVRVEVGMRSWNFSTEISTRPNWSTIRLPLTIRCGPSAPILPGKLPRSITRTVWRWSTAMLINQKNLRPAIPILPCWFLKILRSLLKLLLSTGKRSRNSPTCSATERLWFRPSEILNGTAHHEERLCRNNLIPTLKDAVPGDLSLALPHRIMVDIAEMIEALDKVTPGIASDETLLYGVEVKFYSNKVVVDKDFETSVRGLRAVGDGASSPGAAAGFRQRAFGGQKHTEAESRIINLLALILNEC